MCRLHSALSSSSRQSNRGDGSRKHAAWLDWAIWFCVESKWWISEQASGAFEDGGTPGLGRPGSAQPGVKIAFTKRLSAWYDKRNRAAQFGLSLAHRLKLK